VKIGGVTLRMEVRVHGRWRLLVARLSPRRLQPWALRGFWIEYRIQGRREWLLAYCGRCGGHLQ
jgi:hypothetical protein